MEKLKELFSKHPYLIGGGALVLFVVLYYLFSRQSSGGTTYTTSTGSGDSATNDALSIAQLQSQTALAGKQIDASIASQQISAAQDVTRYQTDAQLTALKSNNDTTVSIAQVQAGQAESQFKALEDIITAQYTTQRQATSDAYAYLTAKDSDYAYLQTHAIDAQSKLASESLAHVKDVGGSQNRTAIILGAQGNYTASNSAAVGQTVSSVSGDNLLSRIAGGAASALTALI